MCMAWRSSRGGPVGGDLRGVAVGGDLRGVAVGLILFSSLDSVWILVFSVPLNFTVPFSQPYRVPV